MIDEHFASLSAGCAAQQNFNSPDDALSGCRDAGRKRQHSNKLTQKILISIKNTLPEAGNLKPSLGGSGVL